LPRRSRDAWRDGKKPRRAKGQEWIITRNLFGVEREQVRVLKSIKALEWHAFTCTMISL
jgi:hypothetical protein